MGDIFVESILENLHSAKVTIAVVSPAYFRSPFCLAELGAAQLRCQAQKTAPFYSLLVPPANYRDHLQGVLYGLQSGTITDTSALDELRDLVIRHVQKPPATAIWTQKRGDFLLRIRPLIRNMQALALMERLIVREACFEPSTSHKITYKLKLRVVLKNDTGHEILVKKPTWNCGPNGAAFQNPFRSKTLQLRANRSWQDQTAQLSIPDGGVFRLWIGLDQDRGLRILQNNGRLGTLGLRVSILNQEVGWQKSL